MILGSREAVFEPLRKAIGDEGIILCCVTPDQLRKFLSTNIFDSIVVADDPSEDLRNALKGIASNQRRFGIPIYFPDRGT